MRVWDGWLRAAKFLANPQLLPPLCLQVAPPALAEHANLIAERANVAQGYLARFAIAVA
jgi:hypothetical protein